MRICREITTVHVFKPGDVVELTSDYTFYSGSEGKYVTTLRGVLALIGTVPGRYQGRGHDFSLTRLASGRISFHGNVSGIVKKLRKVNGCFRAEQ